LEFFFADWRVVRNALYPYFCTALQSIGNGAHVFVSKDWIGESESHFESVRLLTLIRLPVSRACIQNVFRISREQRSKDAVVSRT